MNVGLLYTPVSIYQMTRGSVVLFVGVLSIIFLGRHLWLYQWVSLLTVIIGVALVGFSGSLVKDVVKDTIHTFLDHEVSDTPEPTKVVIGVFFVLFAQLFTASQFVIEEKIMSLWASQSTFFDLPRGWHQMIDNPPVLYSGLIIALSIAFFNFFGLSVTRHVSANSRSLTDTCRTLSIWLISLGLGWENFVWPISLLQVAGFGLLVYGTLLFNNLVAVLPCLKPSGESLAAHADISAEEGQALLGETHDEQQILLSEEALEATAILPADIGKSGFDVLPAPRHR
jgi:drug/metabolite transporter (DMT)-like permease